MRNFKGILLSFMLLFNQEFIPNSLSLEENTIKSSVREIYSEQKQSEKAFRVRRDTLSVIIKQEPVVEEHLYRPNEGYVRVETLDGKEKILRFLGDIEASFVDSTLVPGDTLSFIIPKKVYGPRVDSSTTEYDFSLYWKMPGYVSLPNYFLSLNGKKFK